MCIKVCRTVFTDIQKATQEGNALALCLLQLYHKRSGVQSRLLPPLVSYSDYWIVLRYFLEVQKEKKYIKMHPKKKSDCCNKYCSCIQSNISNLFSAIPIIKPCLIETIQKNFGLVKVNESNLKYWFSTPLSSIIESQRCSQQNVNIFDVGAEIS